MAAVIIIVVVVLIAIVFVAGYNGLVRLRNRIDSAWSQIGVQLERRHDLIPNLIETVKGVSNMAEIAATPGLDMLYVGPNDLTIDQTAADTIATALNAGTNVTQQTMAAGSGGSGDILVNANVSLGWTTGAGLTLSAYRNVSVGNAASLSSTGGGAVTLRADNTGTGVGTVGFGAGSGLRWSRSVRSFGSPSR